MKKICLVIHSLGIGGMERVMSQLAENFSNRENVRVDLVLIGIKREIAYPVPDCVTVHRPQFKFNNSRRRIDTFRTIRFLRKAVKKIDPDVVLSFGELWNNLVLIALWGLRYPVYVSDRSQPDKDLGGLHDYLRDRLYPRAAGFIAQTKKSESIARERGWNRNIRVIGNPIRDVEQDKAVEKENIVLSVGRLIRTKHFDQLIRMFTEIGMPGWKLVIVGGDAKKLTLSEELKALIRELGAVDSVHLSGFKKDVDRYFNKSKVFAFTSSSEGFPNAIGEALSAGLPVVAYDCVAGPSDMISDGENGFLIPLFDQEAFKEKLQLLMTKKDLREQMSLKAVDQIQIYNVEKISDQFYAFLNNTSADKK